MIFFGLHILDLIVLGLYFFVTIAISYWASKKVSNQGDYFLAGRGLGKVLQFFMNFGGMTDGNGAPSTATVVYQNGIGGVWIALQTLFLTPYYWFMNKWFRRMRLTTIGDLFELRFGNKRLASVYAIFCIFLYTFILGLGYLISYKVVEPLLTKPEAEYTREEAKMINDYHLFTELENILAVGELTETQQATYEVLKFQRLNGELKSYVSYLSPLPFFLAYSLFVGLYTIAGGLAAAVLTDVIQSLLIIVFSLLILPLGFAKIGGISGLQEKVPDVMFSLFGSSSVGDFTWYSVLAILFVSWVQIHSVIANMAVSGSAKNEFAARLGAVTGGFSKRFMIIAWAICGLVAVAMYGTNLQDPDTVWGLMSKDLLAPGILGLMLAGLLAGNMSTIDVTAINISALFLNNIYKGIVPNKSDAHYVLVGRIAIIYIMLAGVFVATQIDNVVQGILIFIAGGIVFGAPIYMIFIWRRVTEKAVFISVAVSSIVIMIIPLGAPYFESFHKNASIYATTDSSTKNLSNYADLTDALDATPLFFDRFEIVKNEAGKDTLKGVGRFHFEIWLFHNLGWDFTDYSSAGLLTMRYTINGLFPFIVIIFLSLITKKTNEKLLINFYTRLHTPVNMDLEKDSKMLHQNVISQESVKQSKLWPNSDFEFRRWDKEDSYGLLLCIIATIGILLFLYAILQLIS